MNTFSFTKFTKAAKDLLSPDHLPSLNRLKRLINPPVSPSSLDVLKSPPPVGQLVIRNSYVPLCRRTLIRELLQDTSVILPAERDVFEKFAVSLDKKLEDQFKLLRDEISLLCQSIEPMEWTSPESEAASDKTTLRQLSRTEKLNQEFWLLRRLSELAPAAGFMEVTRNSMEHACRPKRIKREGAVTYVEPKDYEVMHFWIRGVHPYQLQQSPFLPPLPSTSGAGLLERLVRRKNCLLSWWAKSTGQKKSSIKQDLLNRLTKFFRLGNSLNLEPIYSERDMCFGKVLMAVRLKQSDHLRLKMFDNLPTSNLSGSSSLTDSLSYLLPELRFRPLTKGGRAVLLASSATAVGCLGLIAPLAWLFKSSPDVVIAWSFAATAAAVATASIVWSRYWRAQAKLTNRLKQLHYACGNNSGSSSLNVLLQLAREEEFKAALLAYALLLRPSEAGLPISPVQLGVRVESWIAKRLSPTQHLALSPSFKAPESVDFTGGSGPLFDLMFNTDRPLDLLRRMDLVRGSKSNPTTLPLPVAATAIQDDSGKTGGLNRLWLLDPLVVEQDVGHPEKLAET
ncbi:unnamed protein product [Calicophoron daubneyi]|uniref:Transmembrane protein n=1 Tax=Calicophoron daubneyi TaxID=300641 RepID=A0AAV2TTF9_CALDB